MFFVVYITENELFLIKPFELNFQFLKLVHANIKENEQVNCLGEILIYEFSKRRLNFFTVNYRTWMIQPYFHR